MEEFLNKPITFGFALCYLIGKFLLAYFKGIYIGYKNSKKQKNN